MRADNEKISVSQPVIMAVPFAKNAPRSLTHSHLAQWMNASAAAWVSEWVSRCFIFLCVRWLILINIAIVGLRSRRLGRAATRISFWPPHPPANVFRDREDEISTLRALLGIILATFYPRSVLLLQLFPLVQIHPADEKAIACINSLCFCLYFVWPKQHVSENNEFMSCFTKRIFFSSFEKQTD